MEHGIKTGLELKIEIEGTLFETCQLIVVGGYWPGFLVTCICHCPEIFLKSESEWYLSEEERNHCIDCISFSSCWTVASPPRSLPNQI